MIRVGVVGTGGMGNVHSNHYRRISGVELHCFDSDPERLKTFVDRHGAKPADSLDDLLSKVDAVDLCLPTDLHVEVGLKAIAAGKHCLVEKPMAGSVEDCAKLITAAEAKGVVLMPAQVVRFFPEYAAAHRLVKAGKIGTPVVARTRRGGKAPVGSGGWFKDYARSGGVVLDLAIHDYDWLRWTLGEVTSVYCQALLGRSPAGDYSLTTLTHEGGAISHVEGTWMDPGGFRTSFEVCGSEGMIEFDSRNVATLRTSLLDSSAAEAPLEGADDPYYNELSGFIKAIQTNTNPPVTGQDGLRAVAIARAAIESARTGQPIQLAVVSD